MPSMKLRLPSNRTLGNLCAYGAILSVSAVMYMRWKLQDRIRSAEFYKMAIQKMRNHKGAVGLMGEPIKETGFDLSNPNNSCDASYAQFEVKVRGPKDKGVLYFWATNHINEGWLVDRLELEANQHPNKRFLLRTKENSAKKGKVKNEKADKSSAEAKKQEDNFFETQLATTPLIHQPREREAYIQTVDGGKMR